MEQNNLEVWKDIPNYEGYYQISNFGRVKSLARPVYRRWGGGAVMKSETILRDIAHSIGYRRVLLQKDKDKRKFFVHRLVAFAFVDNPRGYSDVNHKDENKANNRADNLEWCDKAYNDSHGTRNKRVAAANTNGLLSKRVVQRDLNGNVVARFPSVSEVFRRYGYSKANVANVCRGIGKTAYGYKWEYER